MASIGIDPGHFRAKIVEPALGALGLPGSEAAIRLVCGTAAQESGLRFLMQDKGPALGLFQIEPATWSDIVANFFPGHSDIAAKVAAMLTSSWRPIDELACNPRFGAAVCRIVYFRAPDPLPDAGDLDGQARYWKRFYNTAGGAGTVAEYVSNYRRTFGG